MGIQKFWGIRGAVYDDKGKKKFSGSIVGRRGLKGSRKGVEQG